MLGRLDDQMDKRDYTSLLRNDKSVQQNGGGGGGGVRNKISNTSTNHLRNTMNGSNTSEGMNTSGSALSSKEMLAKSQVIHTLPAHFLGEPVCGLKVDKEYNAIRVERTLTPPTSSSSSFSFSTSSLTQTLSSPNAPMPHFLTTNTLAGGRPLLTWEHARVPLNTVVTAIVDQWSIAFLDMAKEGDCTAMLLVAQMFLAKKGYGCVRYNRDEGIKWLLKAVDSGEEEACAIAEKLCPEELKQHLALRPPT